MANELAVRYTANDGSEITLNPGVVAQYLVGNLSVQVAPKEMARVMMQCKARNLNPFTDVIVSPHRNKDGSTSLTLVTTKDYFTRNAVKNPRFEGMRAGVVVRAGDVLVKKEGSACYKGEQLLGGWCEVFVSGWRNPIYAEVSLDEYDQHMALWKTKPSTMIRKVAVSQALREAFPEQFGGIYEPEEMGMDDAQPTQEVPVQVERETEAQGEPAFAYEGGF